MNPDDDLHLAYVSRMAPGHDYAMFGAICRTARARNPGRGIAGVLLFDGQRFFQWLHGRPGAVLDLMAAIARDPRHTDVRICVEARRSASAHPPQWRSGYVDAEALDAFLARAGDNPAALADGLARLIAQADLEPGGG